MSGPVDIGFLSFMFFVKVNEAESLTVIRSAFVSVELKMCFKSRFFASNPWLMRQILALRLSIRVRFKIIDQ